MGKTFNRLAAHIPDFGIRSKFSDKRTEVDGDHAPLLEKKRSRDTMSDVASRTSGSKSMARRRDADGFLPGQRGNEVRQAQRALNAVFDADPKNRGQLNKLTREDLNARMGSGKQSPLDQYMEADGSSTQLGREMKRAERLSHGRIDKLALKAIKKMDRSLSKQPNVPLLFAHYDPHLSREERQSFHEEFLQKKMAIESGELPPPAQVNPNLAQVRQFQRILREPNAPSFESLLADAKLFGILHLERLVKPNGDSTGFGAGAQTSALFRESLAYGPYVFESRVLSMATRAAVRKTERALSPLAEKLREKGLMRERPSLFADLDPKVRKQPAAADIDDGQSFLSSQAGDLEKKFFDEEK